MSQPPPPYVNRADVPETFADHCQGVVFDGQTLRLELAVTRFGAPEGNKRPDAERTTACRLVLTPQAALQLHEQLRRLVATLEEKGLVSRRASAPGPTKQ
jgi:hypothetical protein